MSLIAHDAYYNIALLYNEQEADDTARTYFERTVKADPSYKGVHLELGLIAERKGEFPRAIEEYKKEIEIDDLISQRRIIGLDTFMATI